MKITAKHIELAVANHFDWRKNIIVPNISWGLNLHECDVLVMSKSGYLIEVEIKISFSDLKKDFEKPHGHNGNGKIKYLYYAMPTKLVEREDVVSMIPEYAGILRCSPLDNGFVSCGITKEATARSNARPLSEKERFDLVRLGAMRIWNLKRQLIKSLH
jgi:hypothetical protein